MIKLEVESYCHECPGFEATVEETLIPIACPDYYIHCAHRDKCDMIKRYLERKTIK